MQILFVCHRFPYPPNSGSKVRAFHMIRHLHRSHEVTVASMLRSSVEEREASGLAAHCTRYLSARVRNPFQALRMIGRIPTVESSSSGFFHSASLDRQIRDALARERFDLIVVHSSSVAHYVADVTDVPKILDFCDMDSQKWLAYAEIKPLPISLGYRLEGVKLQAEEKRLARQFATCTTATRAELGTLEGYGEGINADWFPNGVDTEYFAPDGEGYDPDSISFIGRMDYYPNQQCMLDFCRDAWPRIRAKRTSARLTIVGADPSAAICRLGDLPGVTVTGSVPDVRPYLLRSAVMVAPLKIARGTQNKILEAMASGVPVVTSSIAARGVDAVAGRDLLVADSPNMIADAVLSLMECPDERDALCHRGRSRVLSHHTWGKAMDRFDGIVESCVTAGARAPDRNRGADPTNASVS